MNFDFIASCNYWGNVMWDFVGRHRWVEYAEKSRYNASQVPAEWHGWLHFITDHTGDEVLVHFPQFISINNAIMIRRENVELK